MNLDTVNVRHLALVATLAAIATLLPALAATAPENQPVATLSELQAAGVEPLDNEALSEMIVGNALLIRDLTDDTLNEVVFFDSGVVVRRPRGPAPEQGEKAPPGPPSRVADYAVEGNRLVARQGDETAEFLVYELEDGIFGYRVGGTDAPRWRIVRRPARQSTKLTVSQLDARGLSPISEARLRNLVVGQTLSLIRRSTGEYFTATYNEDGTRSVVGQRTGTRQTADYGIFGSSLVTTYDGQTFFVTVYDLDGVYLAASNADRGVIDWEIVGVD
jgi:hypothetical protein